MLDDAESRTTAAHLIHLKGSFSSDIWVSSEMRTLLSVASLDRWANLCRLSSLFWPKQNVQVLKDHGTSRVALNGPLPPKNDESARNM